MVGIGLLEVAVLLFLASAFANPLFNGSWTLDHAASERLAPILEAQGLTWIERTLAESGSPTHRIEWTAEKAMVYIKSGWYRRTDELPLDGKPRHLSLPRIGEVDVASEMRDGMLYTKADMTMRNGEPGILETLREIQNPDLMHLTMRFTFPDGEVISAKRIFRRDDD